MDWNSRQKFLNQKFHPKKEGQEGGEKGRWLEYSLIDLEKGSNLADDEVNKINSLGMLNKMFHCAWPTKMTTKFSEQMDADDYLWINLIPVEWIIVLISRWD